MRKIFLVFILLTSGCSHQFEWGLEPSGMTETEKFNMDARFQRHEYMLKALMESVKEIRDNHGMNEVQ